MTDLDDALSTGHSLAGARRKPAALNQVTRDISVTRDTADLDVVGAAGTVMATGTGLVYLEEEGLDPKEWEPTGFRKIKYGKDMESVRFTFRRVTADPTHIDVDAIIADVRRQRSPRQDRPTGQAAFLVGWGDGQFGKSDGDGTAGSFRRTIEGFDAAKARLPYLRRRWNIGTVALPFVGDIVEGFVSQGGANAWRTELTLTEQLRLARRAMYYGVKTFAPTAARVVALAVPGNHGEPQRLSGKGLTRFDDSHDTEALVAVADMCRENMQAYGHVEFYTPEKDEMTVTVDVGDTRLSAAHGHQWAKGKHWDWWRGQAFGQSPLTDADVLVAGHLHHLVIEEEGPKTFVQFPSTESDSVWWRHRKGTRGNPGLFTAVLYEGRVYDIEVMRP